MSRWNDVTSSTRADAALPALPPVDWSLVGQSAPAIAGIDYPGPAGPLPRADAVVMTWTTAEWVAMDHVFLGGSRAEGESAAGSLASSWHLYTRGAPSRDSGSNPLWGYYQLVNLTGSDGTGRRILLFKSDAHLAYSPYLGGLDQELAGLLGDAAPGRLYSIGTAGASTDKQNLGDVVITNSGSCRLEVKENSSSPLNGQTFTSADFFPNTGNLLPDVQERLFFRLGTVADKAEWQRLLTAAKGKAENRSLAPYTLEDLLNAPIDPANLNAPRAVSYEGVPLLTTDYYFIAGQSMPQYCALEMDDAVIGAAAARSNIPFAFIRNISDGLVATVDREGRPIPEDAREAWSAVQYDSFSLYTSLNGALAAWATLVDW